MNVNQLLIAILAGSAAALMSLSVAAGASVSSVLLFYLASAPLLILGLANGLAAVAAGAAAGIVITLLLAGFKTAILFAIATAIPPVLLCRFALLRRPVPESPALEGELRAEGFEWYPEGRLLLWCAAVGAGLALASVIAAAGFDLNQFRDVVRGIFTTMIETAAQSEPGTDPEALLQVVEFAAAIVPPLSAMGLMLSFFASLRLAGAVTAASGKAIRPAGPFNTLRLPRLAGPAFIASFAASLLPGFAGMAFGVVSAVLFAAFAVAGLAVVHWFIRENAAKGMLIFGLYFAVTVLLGFALPLLAGLGVADHYLRLRERKASASTNPDPSSKE